MHQSSSLPLQRVASFKYLGVQITREPKEYITNNIEPLFTYLKSQTQSWARLPLGVMGRINLFKMILLPKFLYILWNSPILIPLKIFKALDQIVNSFIWGSNRHKLAWNTLKNPTSAGGATCILHSCAYLTLLPPPQNRQHQIPSFNMSKAKQRYIFPPTSNIERQGWWEGKSGSEPSTTSAQKHLGDCAQTDWS